MYHWSWIIDYCKIKCLRINLENCENSYIAWDINKFNKYNNNIIVLLMKYVWK